MTRIEGAEPGPDGLRSDLIATIQQELGIQRRWIRNLVDVLIAGPLAKLLTAEADAAGMRAERDAAVEERDAALVVAEMNATSGGFYARHAETAQVRALTAEAALAARARENADLRAALEQAEACMSIVEPRSDKAEYLRILGVVRATLARTKTPETGAADA